MADSARMHATKAGVKHHFRPRSLGRFVVVGGLNTLIGMSSFPLLYWLFGNSLGVNFLLLVAWTLSTAFAFLSHKRVTFKSEGKMHHEGIKFLILSLATLGINLLVMNLALSLTHINPIIIQIFTSVVLAAIMLILSYLGMNHLIFLPAGKK